MLAFSTSLTCGSRICIDVRNAAHENLACTLEVIKPGLMFVVCKKLHYANDDSDSKELRYIYIPNSTLMRDGEA